MMIGNLKFGFFNTFLTVLGVYLLIKGSAVLGIALAVFGVFSAVRKGKRHLRTAAVTSKVSEAYNNIKK